MSPLLGLGLLAGGSLLMRWVGLNWGARRGLSGRTRRVLDLLPGALLGALLVLATSDPSGHLVPDVRAVGLLAALVLLAWPRRTSATGRAARGPGLGAVVLLAAGLAAGLRALAGAFR